MTDKNPILANMHIVDNTTGRMAYLATQQIKEIEDAKGHELVLAVARAYAGPIKPGEKNPIKALADKPLRPSVVVLAPQDYADLVRCGSGLRLDPEFRHKLRIKKR